MLRRGVSNTYGALFEDWEIAVAKKLIAEYQRDWEFLREEGFEDLLQECLMHWYFARGAFDPHREASEKTFMGRVIRNRLTDMGRERGTDKRKAAYSTVSLDKPLNQDDDSCTYLDKLEPQIEGSQANEIENPDMRLDVSKTLKRLSPPQANICHLLGEEGMSVTEISKLLRTPRSTIYDEINRIRAIFEKEGLRDYLK